MTGVNGVYERFGVDLGRLALADETGGDDDRPNPAYGGKLVIAPSSTFSTPWGRRFPDPLVAFASGWMRVRGRARQSGVELPLIISDHADWDELTATITELSPSELWITHGREEALCRWCDLNGQAARPLALVGYGDEAGDAA